MPRSRSSSSLPWLLVGLAGVAALVVGLVWMLRGDDEPEHVVPGPPISRGAPDAPLVLLPEPPEPRNLKPVPREDVVKYGTIVGRLVNAQHQVVGEGVVSVALGKPLGLLGGSGSSLKSLGIETTVSESGAFELPRVPIGSDLVLLADGKGFAPTEAGPFLLEVDELLDVGKIMVNPGISIVGQVIDADARPIAGASVGYDPTGRLSLESAGTGVQPTLARLTDEDGRFEFLHLPETTYELLAAADGYANQVVRADPWENMTSSLVEHRIWMQRATPLVGHVYARESGEPVSGLTVTAKPTGPTRGHGVARTDSEGRFEFEALVVGHYNIIAEGPGRMRDQIHVRKEDFGKSELEMWLHPSGNLRGVVVGPEKEPVKDYQVQLRFSPGKGQLISAPVASDRVRDGEFRFDDMRPGYYTFEVWAPGYAPLQSSPELLEPGQTRELVISLKPASLLRGRVVNDRGEPVRGAKVGLHTNNISTISWLRGDDSKAIWHKSTTTDVDGNYELVDIMPRKYQIEVDHPDYSVLRLNDINAPKNRARELEDLVLETPARIRGVVTATDGSPVAGARVECGGRDMRDEPVVGLSTRTNARGEYSFRRLPPGWYVLDAWVPAEKGRLANPMTFVVTDAQRAVDILENPDSVRLHVGPGETRVKHLTAVFH